MTLPPLAGVTPAAPHDTGRPDEVLAAALAAGDVAAALSRLLAARLLVPVVAERADGADAVMAVPLLEGAAGRALPVFSGVEQLRRWRPDARPVPMTGARVVTGAVAAGHDGIVLDIAGPVPLQVSGPTLAGLAAAAAGIEQGVARHVQVVTGPG